MSCNQMKFVNTKGEVFAVGERVLAHGDVATITSIDSKFLGIRYERTGYNTSFALTGDRSHVVQTKLEKLCPQPPVVRPESALDSLFKAEYIPGIPPAARYGVNSLSGLRSVPRFETAGSFKSGLVESKSALVIPRDVDTNEPLKVGDRVTAARTNWSKNAEGSIYYEVTRVADGHVTIRVPNYGTRTYEAHQQTFGWKKEGPVAKFVDGTRIKVGDKVTQQYWGLNEVYTVERIEGTQVWTSGPSHTAKDGVGRYDAAFAKFIRPAQRSIDAVNYGSERVGLGDYVKMDNWQRANRIVALGAKMTLENQFGERRDYTDANAFRKAEAPTDQIGLKAAGNAEKWLVVRPGDRVKQVGWYNFATVKAIKGRALTLTQGSAVSTYDLATAWFDTVRWEMEAKPKLFRVERTSVYEGTEEELRVYLRSLNVYTNMLKMDDWRKSRYNVGRVSTSTGLLKEVK